MRRTAAALAAALTATLLIGGPFATVGRAAPAPTLECATSAPPAACELLDELATQLAPTAPVLGLALAPLTGPARGFLARSGQPGGVPSAEVVGTSEKLLAALDALPAPVKSLVGQMKIDGLVNTLGALLAELTAPVTGVQQPASSSKPTPAGSTATTPSSKAAPSSSGSSTSTSTSGGTTASSSSPAVPAVPVGEPLALPPLAMPAFWVANPSIPLRDTTVEQPAADVARAGAYEDAIDALGGGHEGGVEPAVIVALSLLLLVGAGLAQVHQSRSVVPGG